MPSDLYIAAINERVHALVVPADEQPHAVPLYGKAVEVALAWSPEMPARGDVESRAMQRTFDLFARDAALRK